MIQETTLSAKPSLLKKQFEENGFTTKPFPQELRVLMLNHIDAHIRDTAASYLTSPTSSLEKTALSVPDEVWSKKMNRAFRIFPKDLSEKIHQWADSSIRKEFGRTRSAVNVVYPQEAEMNPKITKQHIAIYWRCVRPGKPDAGRPHRDASFWVLEFEEGYDPKIPFPFDYLKDCIKIWIPIKGCTPQTTLQIIPRSHKMEIPTTVEQTEYGRRPTIDGSWLQKYEKDFTTPQELSQGSCIIFDMNLVHRGPTHNNNELRISAELCFILQ
ncbi:MAG TPA: phytanoyl-CoA dioxygenase family protein [Chlamydiales bacterium]|nr:phytanoyl-CoA dioxygenase family protein [Chlamydiales bacterium]